MGWDGGGNVNRTYDWTTDRDAGAPDHFIQAAKMDTQEEDLATAIEACINRNGENAVTANISWGTNKITNLGAATGANDAVRARQIAENSVQYGGTTGGSSNAYTVTNAILSSVAVGTRLLCLANHTNDGASTVNVNGAGAVAVVRKDGSTALSGGEIVSGDFFEVAYDGTSFVLVNSTADIIIDGALSLGIADTTPGILSLFGGGTGEQGGEARFYNNADDDGTIDWWGIEAEDGTGNLAITQAGTPVARFLASAYTLDIGEDDGEPGSLYLRGGGTGEASGELRIHNDADNDGTVGYWGFLGSSGALIIAPDGGAADVTIDTSGNVTLAAQLTVGSFADANRASLTAQGVVEMATAAEFWGDDSTAHLALSPAQVWDAAIEQALTSTSNAVAWDMSAGIHFKIDTLAESTTIGAPTNTTVGKTGRLRIIQDSGGSNTVAWNSVFKWPGGTAPAATTTGDATDTFWYSVISDTHIEMTYALDNS